MTEVIATIRGRVVTTDDVATIRDLITSHPKLSRRRLSTLLCEAWGWRQANGQPKDMVCRSLMLALHRAGHIELPPVRHQPPNNVVERAKPETVEVDRSPVEMSLRDLGAIELRQVRRTGEDERLLDGLMDAHHYLGYTRPVGEHLKFLACARGRPVACFAWSASSPRIAARDRFIGWSLAAQYRNIHLSSYNTRFLVLPWVRVPHLASHLLGRMTRELSSHWQAVYGHPIYFVETYVDRERFAGTCYRAANWLHLGTTTGRGKDSPTRRARWSRKDVLGLPLTRRFRELLRAED